MKIVERVVGSKENRTASWNKAVRWEGYAWLRDAAHCLVLEEIFNGVVGYHTLIEDVSTRLGALDHFDDFRV